MLRVLAGDASAIDELASRLSCVRRIVRSLAMRMGRCAGEHTREDVVQDVMMTVWRRLADYRGDAKLETWVFRVCVLQLQNASRREATRRGLALTDIEPPVVESEVHAIECIDQVQNAMRYLTSTEAEVVELKHYSGMTFEEIGAETSLSPNTVKTRYYRAIGTLRRVLISRAAG